MLSQFWAICFVCNDSDDDLRPPFGDPDDRRSIVLFARNDSND